eukprot:CAMPEP_0197271232 /NCGR_PEP_ID=MMETSP1432-20130617/8268_1 /TAXON_ID=44447 /ORGANISM="Pseudo-nitzschia delicatissima, Strain UNC1205" /LENGTH=76 /DNA_ID=CAMNT_0042736633 /DNA_START=120 /DNA_END=350 /DNA_ORIENTATION=+
MAPPPTTNQQYDPRTPVVVAQTKKIDTTAAESADMNRLLQRLEWGNVDLQSQLDIINSDNILCGLQNLATRMPKKD